VPGSKWTPRRSTQRCQNIFHGVDQLIHDGLQAGWSWGVEVAACFRDRLLEDFFLRLMGGRDPLRLRLGDTAAGKGLLVSRHFPTHEDLGSF
jgi:hypothetical protein